MKDYKIITITNPYSRKTKRVVRILASCLIAIQIIVAIPTSSVVAASPSTASDISLMIPESFSASQTPEFTLTQKLSVSEKIVNRILQLIRADQSLRQVSITDPQGVVVYNEPFVGESLNVHLNLPSFIPGKYIVKVNDQVMDDFSWGVLAVNPHKSLYKAGEKANLAFAVLDAKGMMVCDARLTLTIKNPDGKETTLSTDNGQITVNGACSLHAYTTEPDYEALYQTTTIGAYTLSLTAETKDGTHSLTDSFAVEKNPQFSIERRMATRLFPTAPYPSTIVLTAREDFKGTVVETVPQDFAVSAGATGTVSYSSVKAEKDWQRIYWDVSLKKGQSVTLGYTFDPPDTSPDFFLAGPLVLKNSLGMTTFSEQRQWQMANDAPSQIVDGAAATGTSYGGHRRVIRTTHGSNSTRTFAAVNNGADQVLYFSDDPDAASPTWNSTLTYKAGITLRVADMVWDETNDVLYMCYARGTLSDATNTDVFYRRVSGLGDATPTLGAEQTVFDGNTGSTTYNDCHIEIAGDGGTDKVVIVTNAGTAGGVTSSMVVRAGTLNSDTPTFTTEYTIKSWTATQGTGAAAIGRVNTNKLVLLYYDSADMVAVRHDDAAAIDASSGWDALDGTDNSQTTLSTDGPPGSQAITTGSVVGDFDSDTVWFGWLDTGNDIQTIRWSGSTLDTQLEAAALASSTIGPAMTTDGTTLYIVYRSIADATQVALQTRPMNDGLSAWSGTEIILDDVGTESVTYPNVPKKLYQGKLDLLTTSDTSFLIRHASGYQIKGNAYQQSGSSTYEGTTVWDKCDGTTTNVSVSIAGGTKYSTWCDSTTGEYSFVLPQPAATDSDITVFLDADATMVNGLVGHWKMNEASWNGTTDEVIDSSSNSFDGVRTGNATTTTGQYDNGGTFDGNGDYVTVLDAPALRPGNGSWTMSAWINATNVDQTGVILGKFNIGTGEGFGLTIVADVAANPGKKISLSYQSATGGDARNAITNADVVDGNWHHVAAVLDKSADAIALYVDGAAVAKTDVTSGSWPTIDNTDSFIIGSLAVLYHYSGLMDDMRVYNRALTANEIDFLATYDATDGSGIKGAAFTHNADAITDITGLSLYHNRSIIRSESSTAITNADINTYDQTADLDIPLSSDGTDVTADAGTKINVNTGDTYTPGGNVTTPKLHVRGTYTGASETLTLTGSGSSSSCDDTLTNIRPLCIDGGTFTPTSNTTLFTGSSASLIQNATYNTLRIEPSANSITHTLMAGTTTANGNITFGNGTNTGVTVTAAANSSTLTANANITIAANTTFVANGSNTTTVRGNWTKTGSFTHSSGTVAFSGADSSTQTLTGDTTFHNFTASTAGNTAGRTLQFTGSSTTTVAGTWTIAGASGKVLTLQSSDTNSWNISPTAASVDYATVSRSTSDLAICATHSTDGNNNNANWTFTAGASCTPNTNFNFEGVNMEGININ